MGWTILIKQHDEVREERRLLHTGLAPKALLAWHDMIDSEALDMVRGLLKGKDRDHAIEE
jgi:hypothetical protein